MSTQLFRISMPHFRCQKSFAFVNRCECDTTLKKKKYANKIQITIFTLKTHIVSDSFWVKLHRIVSACFVPIVHMFFSQFIGFLWWKTGSGSIVFGALAFNFMQFRKWCMYTNLTYLNFMLLKIVRSVEMFFRPNTNANIQ